MTQLTVSYGVLSCVLILLDKEFVHIYLDPSYTLQQFSFAMMDTHSR